MMNGKTNILPVTILLSTTLLLSSCGGEPEEVTTTTAPTNVENVSSGDVENVEWKSYKDVKVPDEFMYSGVRRVLNGVGVRKQYMMDIYVAALYVDEKTSNAKAILTEDRAMSMRLEITSRLITNEKMKKAIGAGISRSMGGKTDGINSSIDVLMEGFGDVESQVGDVYEIHYTPAFGLSGSKNGEPYGISDVSQDELAAMDKDKGTADLVNKITLTEEGHQAIPGLEYKNIIFGIWLCPDPVDENLKDQLLGIDN